MYGKLRDVFKNDLPIGIKWQHFSRCVLKVITFGAETSTLTVASGKKLRMAQRKMERSMLGVLLKDHIKNEDLRMRTGFRDVV